MWKWVKRRLSEASTWAGLSAVTVGAGTILKADGMPEFGQAVGQAGQHITGGDVATGVAVLVMSALACFVPEKGGGGGVTRGKYGR